MTADNFWADLRAQALQKKPRKYVTQMSIVVPAKPALCATIVSRDAKGNVTPLRPLAAAELNASGVWQDYAYTSKSGETLIRCGRCGTEIHTDEGLVVDGGDDMWCSSCAKS